MSAPIHDQLLAQLQGEVNKVLEQTGRMFTAVARNRGSNNNGKSAAPVAQIHKLKRILPECDQRFQNALDQLENELQMAKLVMRRDLALCRERSGISPKPADEPVVASTALNANGASEEQTQDSEVPTFAPEEDVVMLNSAPANAKSTAEYGTAKETTAADAVSEDADKEKPDSEDPVAGTQDVTIAADTQKADLHIDTHPEPAAPEGEDEAPPDTGTFSNTNADLDSLFGGPMSAGEDGGTDFADLTAQNTNVDDSAGAAADFDFDTFATSLSTSNDANTGIGEVEGEGDLASLLPGLEDYANTQPTGGDGAEGDAGFDALFVGPSIERDGGGDGPEEFGGHRDSTFDDLFDLEDFHTEDFGGESAGGQGTNGKFDFGVE